MSFAQIEAEHKTMSANLECVKYLRMADQCVRRGNYTDALTAIRKARAADPYHLYALAYEERVLKLIAQSGHTVPEQPRSRVTHESPEAQTFGTVSDLDVLLDQTNAYLAAGDFAAALESVRTVRCIEPESEEFQLLEEHIRSAFERQLETEFNTQERETLQAFVQKHIQDACACAARGEFDSALQCINQGALIDPSNTDLQDCGALVKVARNVWAPVAEEQQCAQVHAKRILDNLHRVEVVKHRTVTAREYLANGAFDEALAEVALGLLEAPTNRELEDLEQAIWKSKTAEIGREEALHPPEANGRLLRLYLLAAEEFARYGEFQQAIDHVVKACAIDPTNTDIKKVEIRIRQHELRARKDGDQPLRLVHPQERRASNQ